MSSHLTIGLADTHAQVETLGNTGPEAGPMLTALLVGLLVAPATALMYRHSGASVPKSVKRGGLAFACAATFSWDLFPISFCVNIAT
ncbi:hypothetical protein [Streptomyces sp. NBC_01451]|uniref:hypothetical protein n=1 Tax=Streptomyces sp. NBC_01451 TaxID=2903872 RepID=UPI002E3590F5|nr:hypothetical protein [Streptomyces sp. NBC_01451]